MSGRVRGGARSSRALSTFAVLVAGGMVFGGVAIAFGAPWLWVLLAVVVVAAFLAGAVTR